MRITAAVLENYDTPFVLQDLDLEEPRAGEVVVKIAATGICHTDGLAQHEAGLGLGESVSDVRSGDVLELDFATLTRGSDHRIGA